MMKPTNKMAAAELTQHMRFHHGYDHVTVFSKPLMALENDHRRLHEDETAKHLDHTHEENE